MKNIFNFKVKYFNKIKKIISLGVIIIMALSFFGCNSPKSKGTFYDLQKAYDDGLLTVEDLESIASYNASKSSKTLNTDIEMDIKESYAYVLRTQTNLDGTLMFPDAIADEVKIKGYYGTYNGNVAVKIIDSYTEYPAVMKEKVVADVSFKYSGACVVIWKEN